VAELERVDRRDDRRGVVDQPGLDQQPQLEVGVAAALADAHASAVDGDRTAYDEVDVPEVLEPRQFGIRPRAPGKRAAPWSSSMRQIRSRTCCLASTPPRHPQQRRSHGRKCSRHRRRRASASSSPYRWPTVLTFHAPRPPSASTTRLALHQGGMVVAAAGDCTPG
jgi:hypothetical protein